MSYQSYLDSIETKTGKSPSDFKKMAAEKGFAYDGGLTLGTKASEIIAWLKQEFDLGCGHAMAVVALLQHKKQEGDA